MEPTEFHNLIQQLLDEEISAVDFARLEQEMRGNPEALAAYKLYATLHCGLVRHGEMNAAIRQTPVVPVDLINAMQRRKVAKIAVLAAAAVILFTAVILRLSMAPEPLAVQASFRSVEGSTVSISRADGTKAAAERRVLTQGSTIRLEHGAVELALPHQVRAILEAPSSLTLVDDRTVAVDQGRAFFEVPTAQGHGFTVETPDQKIIDLGTAFGIDLAQDTKRTTLHVTQGRVRIGSLRDNQRGDVVEAPRSVVLKGHEIVDELPADSARLLTLLPKKLETVVVEDFETGLLAGKRYEITMDPTVLRNPDGEYLSGMPVEAPWEFSTARELRIVNPSFEAERADKGQPITGWPEITETRNYFNTTSIGAPAATDGSLFLEIVAGRTLAQDLGVRLTPGSTYTLVIDARSRMDFPAGEGVVSLFGSDQGPESPFAQLEVSPNEGEWARNQVLNFTATKDQATSQTLGVALSATKENISFDHIRIFESAPAPQLAGFKFCPEPNEQNASLSRFPTIALKDSVSFGSGRVFVTNRTDDTEQIHFVGSEQLSIAGNQLRIRPTLELADGMEQIGGIPGWVCEGLVSRFNPDGTSGIYRNDDLADHTKARGMIGAMKGPMMARLTSQGFESSIQRTIGTAEIGRTYTLSVGIGNPDKPTPFPGYRIQLLCGSNVVKEITASSPPGPSNSVASVGFSWNSEELPPQTDGQTPLQIRISTHQEIGEPGDLDLDHVRVSAMGGGI